MKSSFKSDFKESHFSLNEILLYFWNLSSDFCRSLQDFVYFVLIFGFNALALVLWCCSFLALAFSFLLQVSLVVLFILCYVYRSIHSISTMVKFSAQPTTVRDSSTILWNQLEFIDLQLLTLKMSSMVFNQWILICKQLSTN